MPITSVIEPLAKAAAPAVKAARGLIQYSPEAEKGTIGLVGKTLFGLRRPLERLEPKIPSLIDGVHSKLENLNNAFTEDIREVITKSGIKPGDPRLEKVVSVLEGKQPSTILDAQEKHVYSFAKTTYNKFANQLGLEPNQRITNYFTHIVEPGNWRMLEEAIAGRVPPGSLTPTDQVRLSAMYKLSKDNQLPIGDTLNLYRKSHSHFSDILQLPGFPKRVRDVFLEARKGFPVYSKDFYQVLDVYGRAAHRKIHLEPTLRQVSLLAHKLPTTVRDQLETVIRFGVLHQPSQIDKALSASFAPFDTFIRTITRGKASFNPQHLLRSVYDTLAVWDIGFSPSPIKKHFVADMVSIFSELGPTYTAAGLANLRNKRLLDLARTKGNIVKRQTPLDIFQEYQNPLRRGLGGAWDGVQKSAFFMYSQVDLMNQYTAWIGAYLQAKSRNVRLAPVAQLVKNGFSLENAAIEYANKINRYTVPRQSPLDIPGVFTGEYGEIARLALQFSSKKMQRAELVWDQFKRVFKGDIGPFGRTLLITAWMTGTPFDDILKNKTGLDPERIPTYAFLKKLGFGMKKTLWNFAPSLGPLGQMVVGKNINQNLDRIPVLGSVGEGVQDALKGPAIIKKIQNVVQETRTGKFRSATGEYAGDVKRKPAVFGVPLESLQKALGFDPSGSRQLTDEFAKHMREYRSEHLAAARELSTAYYEHVTNKNDWTSFYNEMSKIQTRHPDVLVTTQMLNAAVRRVETPRLERMQRHAPKQLR